MHWRQVISHHVYQFGSSFKITSVSGDRITLKQTFNSDAGPYYIMGIKNTRDIYIIKGSNTVARGVENVGASVCINTVHDANKKTYSVHVDWKEAFNDDPAGSFYDKYGADSGLGAIVVTWSSGKFCTQ